MKVKILSSKLPERQGGVTTYVDALKEYLPMVGVSVAEDTDYDVLLHVGPHAYREVPDVLGRRSVVVVHDLIPEILWKDAGVRAERARALAAADAVIAVSAWTKRDVMREYGLADGKVQVVHHGVSSVQNVVENARVRLPFRPGYLLYVGKRNEYKRFRWFLRAVAPVMWCYPSLRLLCTGEPFCRREWAWILALGLLGRVRSCRISAESLPNVYAQAAALVYPSVYEGFGLPILEAMASGCPVVCSRSTCIPEVAGDAAAYFEIDDAKDLRKVLKGFIGANGSDNRIRADYITRGRERARQFSWEKCARETAEILSRCLIRKDENKAGR